MVTFSSKPCLPTPVHLFALSILHSLLQLYLVLCLRCISVCLRVDLLNCWTRSTSTNDATAMSYQSRWAAPKGPDAAQKAAQRAARFSAAPSSARARGTNGSSSSSSQKSTAQELDLLLSPSRGELAHEKRYVCAIENEAGCRCQLLISLRLTPACEIRPCRRSTTSISKTRCYSLFTSSIPWPCRLMPLGTCNSLDLIHRGTAWTKLGQQVNSKTYSATSV